MYFAQDELAVIIRDMTARPDITWGMSELEDLAIYAEQLDGMSSVSFEIMAVGIKCRSVALQIAQLASVEEEDDDDDVPPYAPDPTSSTKASSIPSTSPAAIVPPPDTALNDPSVFHFLFLPFFQLIFCLS